MGWRKIDVCRVEWSGTMPDNSMLVSCRHVSHGTDFPCFHWFCCRTDTHFHCINPLDWLSKSGWLIQKSALCTRIMARKKQDRKVSQCKVAHLNRADLKTPSQEAIPSNPVLTNLFYNSVIHLWPWCVWSFWQLSLPVATDIVSLTLCACMYKYLHVYTCVLVFVYHAICLYSFFLCLCNFPVLCPAMLCVFVIHPRNIGLAQKSAN